MKFAAILLSVFISVSSFSQDSLSFKHFLKVGLENNFAVKIVRNNQEILKNNTTAGNAGMLPTIDATGRYTEQHILNSRTERVNADPIIKSNVKTTSLTSGVALNWNIFDGFQMFIQFSKLNELQKLGELNTRMTIENLISDIGSECFNYIQLKKKLGTLNYVMTISKERLNVARERYLIGNLSKLEYQQASVDFNTDSANFMNQTLAVSASRVNLNRILGINPSTMTEVQDSVIIDSTMLYTALQESTLSKNTSLLIAGKNQTLSALELKLLNSRVYPILSVNGGYNFSKTTDPSNIATARKSDGINYGASVSFNIFNGWTYYKERSNAKIAIKNTEIAYKSIEQDVISQLAIIYEQYQNAIRMVSLQNSNLKTASDNFQIAMEKYRLGSLSGLEIRDIQRAYLDAEDRLLSAQYQAKLAEISLKLISGRISEYL